MVCANKNGKIHFHQITFLYGYENPNFLFTHLLLSWINTNVLCTPLMSGWTNPMPMHITFAYVNTHL